jgi:hypothetical protein
VSLTCRTYPVYLHSIELDWATTGPVATVGGVRDALADEDRDVCFRTLHRLHAARDQMRIIPSHDYVASRTLLPDEFG